MSMRNLGGVHAQRCRNRCTTTPICVHNGHRFSCTRGAVYADLHTFGQKGCANLTICLGNGEKKGVGSNPNACSNTFGVLTRIDKIKAANA